jgi:hypothetical protein
VSFDIDRCQQGPDRVCTDSGVLTVTQTAGAEVHVMLAPGLYMMTSFAFV